VFVRFLEQWWRQRRRLAVGKNLRWATLREKSRRMAKCKLALPSRLEQMLGAALRPLPMETGEELGEHNPGYARRGLGLSESFCDGRTLTRLNSAAAEYHRGRA
jgi:hypothetical protein